MAKYNETVYKLRNERRSLLKVVEDLSMELEYMLNTFSLDEGQREVYWSDLKKLPIGVSFQVNKGVNFIKYFDAENEMKFTTYMKPNSAFGLQVHDCKEIVKVLQGHLIEVQQHNKEYKKNEVVVYEKNQIHKPISNEVSVYDVQFIKE